MKPYLNLFGELDTLPLPALTPSGKRRTKASGYPRRPGSGPAGQTCANCIPTGGHRKTYFKCAVIRYRWTHGPGTDILKKSPACELWKSKTHSS